MNSLNTYKTKNYGNFLQKKDNLKDFPVIKSPISILSVAKFCRMQVPWDKSTYFSSFWDLRSCSPLKPLTALSIGDKAAKVLKTTLLASRSDFLIISFQKNKLNIACS